MSKITTTLLALGLVAASPSLLTAQTVVVEQPEEEPAEVWVAEPAEGDTIELRVSDYAKSLGIEDWDEIEEDSIIPITPEQAEKLIATMIVAARADSQRKLKEEEVLNDFKVETLKNKLLEAALRKVYTEDYEKRLDRLETLLIIALAQQNGGKLDPTVMNYLLGGDATNPILAGATATPQEAMPQDGVVPGAALTDGEMVPLAPGAQAASWDHFLSQVFYAFDSDELTDEAKDVLDNVAGWIEETKMPVELRGYASPEGNMSYNNKLSGRRVNAAADYLKSKGITADYLRIIPSGEDTIKEKPGQYPDARRVDIRPYYGE